MSDRSYVLRAETTTPPVPGEGYADGVCHEGHFNDGGKGMATQEKVLIATGSEAELIVSRVTLIRDIAGQAIGGETNVREALGRIRVIATGLGVQLGARAAEVES